MARRSKELISMRTLQSYQAEDFENHGSPFDAPWDEPEAPKVVKGDATEKQITFLIKLMDERDLPWTQDQLDKLSKRDASALIKTLLDGPKPTPKPKPGKPAVAPEVTEGMYRTPDGTIFKVQRAVHGSGHLYAKQLKIDDSVTPADVWFDYAAGAIRKLRPEWKMTLEQAKEFGALYGTCCVCGRTLTDEKSIDAGIGPICAGKF